MSGINHPGMATGHRNRLTDSSSVLVLDLAELVSNLTVAEVQAMVASGEITAQQAADAEAQGKGRKTIVNMAAADNPEDSTDG